MASGHLPLARLLEAEGLLEVAMSTPWWRMRSARLARRVRCRPKVSVLSVDVAFVLSTPGLLAKCTNGTDPRQRGAAHEERADLAPVESQRFARAPTPGPASPAAMRWPRHCQRQQPLLDRVPTYLRARSLPKTVAFRTRLGLSDDDAGEPRPFV
jgi:hypothetical protein